MNFLWNSAIGLLVVTGGLLGLTLPFGKIATEGGVSAILWSFVISCGAGGVLLVVLLARRQRFTLNAHKLRYFVVAAAISYAIPNLLMFSAIRHLGAGYTGIMFTLSPVITLVLSLLLGVRRPNMLGVAGIVVGFVGAVMVALTRGEAGQPADLFSASAMFAFFFRLQAVGGPVYLSQIGYVAAAIGLIAGTLFLGERYQALTWIGALIITAGVFMTTKAQLLER